MYSDLQSEITLTVNFTKYLSSFVVSSDTKQIQQGKNEDFTKGYVKKKTIRENKNSKQKTEEDGSESEDKFQEYVTYYMYQANMCGI